jgi:hypothetical protein
LRPWAYVYENILREPALYASSSIVATPSSLPKPAQLPENLDPYCRAGIKIHGLPWDAEERWEEFENTDYGEI